MSDAYIVRRGKIIQGGGGFDPNGAILKVVTSTGCTVAVTGTGYSQTQQDGDGFPRSDDANVTEHFFSIPASAFGTITVKSTNTYGDNTKTVSVNTAGRAYEVLCGGKNIILNSAFGLQSGYTPNSSYWTYSDRDKTLNAPRAWYVNVFTTPIPVSAYSMLTITASTGADYNAKLIDSDDRELCGLSFSGSSATVNLLTQTGSITDKYYPTADFIFYGTLITEIVLT